MRSRASLSRPDDRGARSWSSGRSRSRRTGRTSGALAFVLAPVLAAGAGCATPSKRELAEQQALVAQMGAARAVHMPKEVESCVGVTLRLGDPGAPAEVLAERATFEGRVTDAEVAAAVDAAGLAVCKDLYLDAAAKGQIAREPLLLKVDYGVDPAGRTCAVVERTRMDPVDPAAAPVIEQAAGCLKDVLLRARFPEGRVQDRERIVRTFQLGVAPDAPKP